MKRFVLILLLALLAAPAFGAEYAPAFMWAQNAALAVGRTATVSGNWSATTTWNGSTVPVAGDSVSAATFAVAIQVGGAVMGGMGRMGVMELHTQRRKGARRSAR